MSERISPSPRGKRRRPIEVPLLQPDIDIDGVMQFAAWRAHYYKKPILDDLTGYYQFYPTKAGVKNYTRPRLLRMPKEMLEPVVGKEAARLRRQQRLDHEAARERQRLHIAESTELATAVFLSVAVMRKTVLLDALANVCENQQPEWDVAMYAADAIEDFGLCLEAPVETDPLFVNKYGGKRLPNGMRDRLDGISPNMGTRIVSFGAYSKDHPEALRSADGVVLMQTALEEQDYRIAAWEPRHQAVMEVFPDLPQSREILLMRLSLPELLSIEDNLPGAKF